MKIILDSSFVIALCKEDDSQHSDAMTYLLENEIRVGELHCSYFILSEIMTVATYKQISINAIQTFLTDYEVVLYETPLWQYLNYFYTLGKRISVADASVLYDAQIYNADQVLTLDDELDTIFEKINI